MILFEDFRLCIKTAHHPLCPLAKLAQKHHAMQRIDKELEESLANLEKEKEDALKDLDAQVRSLLNEAKFNCICAIIHLSTCCFCLCSGWETSRRDTA